MSPSPSLHFLRPYAGLARKPLGAARSSAAYLRFYHLARQHELACAGALEYPRLRHHASPMRIPVFRHTYRHIEAGVAADHEVVLYGRLQSVRRVSSKLVFLDLKAEFEGVQGLCNFARLEPSGATLGAFKQLIKLLNRGDIVCT